MDGKHAGNEVSDLPELGINYQSSLTRKYQQDHQNILSIFNNVLTAVQQADSKTFLSGLRDLQIALRKHLLDEELNLYIYLRHCHAHEKDKQELINKFKRQSKKVGMETFEFIGRLSSDGYSITFDDAFFSELLAVGNKLENLLNNEETYLFPLYRRR